MKKYLTKAGSVVAVAGLIIGSGSLAFAQTATQQYKQAYNVPLTGAQQVPAVETTATGNATFKVADSEREIDFTVSASNTPDVQAGHIHCGAAGQNGPVIADLLKSPVTNPSGEIAKGTLTNADIKAAGASCSPGINNVPQLVQAMREGTVYVNLHTAAYPNGLIRGQINASTQVPVDQQPPVTPQPPTQPALDAKLLATSNPDGATNDSVVGLSSNLQNTAVTVKDLTGITSIQSIKYSGGKAYITYDAGNNTGGVIVASDIANKDTYTYLAGTNTGLVAPKGIEIVPSKNLMLVSDNGSKTVRAFALNATGNTAPTIVVDDLGNTTRNVWDTSYDVNSDTLFVAGTEGTVIIYDDFSIDGDVNGPTKLIIPTDAAGKKLSVNLHGIEYVQSRDSLILSDVGSATNATDGQIFVVSNVMQTSGKKVVNLVIAGGETKLGNPVDITFDGQQLYVAEKSNDKVLQFNDIFGRSGAQNQAANYVATVLKPESVSLK